MYSLIWSTQLFELKMQNELIIQSSIFSVLIVRAKWKPDKNAASGNVFAGCYFDADKS